jgi:phosphate transport system permease protein
VVIERREWGNLYGFIKEVRDHGQVVAEGSQQGWEALQTRLPDVSRVYDEIRFIETKQIGEINYAQEQIRLRLRKLELQGIRVAQRCNACSSSWKACSSSTPHRRRR